ncbi:hypothetical protein F4780DRAFT_412933 [Xylariomycetidae sp. FL0641]|nr:hypothetical protein F4780DRAFT_412933 [Xylariomycetidae sp. FL0641]
MPDAQRRGQQPETRRHASASTAGQSRRPPVISRRMPRPRGAGGVCGCDMLRCGLPQTDGRTNRRFTDYRETAVKFQKEWHVQEPHRQLDFAPHVKSHALVNVLNKGLLYSSLEREYAQASQVSC